MLAYCAIICVVACERGSVWVHSHAFKCAQRYTCVFACSFCLFAWVRLFEREIVRVCVCV